MGGHGYRNLELASTYVPASARERKIFLNKLLHDNPLNRDTIVGGDFNCVIDVNKDVCYATGVDRTYQNHHAPLVEKLMNRAKLTDLHNRVNATDIDGFTREESNVKTRIDRIYARDNDSKVVWTEVEVDHSITAIIHTDHSPVIATAMALGKHMKRRINTEVLYDPDIRIELHRIMNSIQERFGGWKGQRARGVWEEFKNKAFNLLMGMTKRKERQEKRAEDYIPILGLEYRLMGILREGTPPSVAKTREMDKLKEEIKEARKKLRPAAGQNALGRLQAEELMTKKFFGRFKNKHANTNILELHKTEDWDEPELGEATQDEAEIAEEATKYYKWLYKTKETDDREARRLLDILRRNPIPAHIAREADTQIGEKHVTQAIRSAGTGKSPGPDGLPAEFYKHYEDLIVPLLTEVINHSYLEGSLHTTMRE